jgi:hypothetical protein
VLRESEESAAEEALPLGHIAHASSSRLRLSFPDLKGQYDSLEALCAAARRLDGVHSAEGRPLTGSVIIAHDGSPEDLVHAARKARVFDVQDVPEEQPGPVADAMAWKDWADRSLRDTIGPNVNLRTIAGVAFIAMAVRQLAAGSILPPAATALWYGMSLLLAANPEPDMHLESEGE